MKSLPIKILIFLIGIILLPNQVVHAQESVSNKKVTLQYISPSDLTDADILKDQLIQTAAGPVSVKVNASTNEILLIGNDAALQLASAMIVFLDVPPKQIIVEVKIIEVDNNKIQKAGIDWQHILSNTSIPFQYNFTKHIQDNSNSERSTQITNSSIPYTVYSQNTSDRNTAQSGALLSLNNSMRISDFLNILVGSDGAKVLNIPKIVTVNNKKGTILDGSRILYIDKYASYSNLFQTQELKTGLFLSVTPTIGSSGYIKMNVEAKLTRLSMSGNELRPVEIGQMLENIVVVKEGESIMLGGLKKTSTITIDNSIPILGSILPFLFSSTKNIEETNDVLLIITPTVINLSKMDIPDILKEKEKK